MKKKTFLIGAVATLAMGTAAALVFAGNSILKRVSGVGVHNASCEWNHYEAVMPTTSGHGSQEFWACCTHAGEYVLEEPSEGNVTEQGAFDGEFFNNLDSNDDRYIPQLSAVSGADAISPVTLSDVGIANGAVVPSGASHLWGNYDYVANGRGIDLWIKVDYPKPSGNDYYSLFYLFSDGEEGGIVFRFGFSRTEDDGIIPCYVYTQNDYSANPGTTVVHTAGSAGTKFWLPRSSGVKSTTSNILHLTAYCIDESTNLYRCAFTAGVEGGTQWNLSTNPEDQTNAAQSFDICLGANYFDNGAGRKVRISCNAANIATVYDATSEEKTVVYKDASGNVFGKLENQNTAVVPHLTASGKTFLGWFDNHGNRPVNGDAVSSKLVLTPRFVDNQANMFVPSDTLGNEFAAAKGGWYDSTSFGGECGGQLPVSQVTNRYDFYYIYHFVSKSANDNYAIFGFPFDFLDAGTRIHLRIDNPSDDRLKGYIYGPATNLGNAGADGTYFEQSGFRANRANLLIHIAVYNASAAGLTLLVEVTNLGDGQVYQTTREVTFNDPTLYAINNPGRNVFDLMKANCEYRITDAF